MALFDFGNFNIFSEILGPPEITTAYLERYVAQEGDTVKLVCPIIGTPRPIIEWYQVSIFLFMFFLLLIIVL